MSHSTSSLEHSKRVQSQGNQHAVADDEADLGPLSRELNASVDSLSTLGVKWSGDRWSWAERDEDGERIGSQYRKPQGHSRSTKGSKRGLVYPAPLKYAGSSVVNPLLIVEGMSDTAAAITLGFDAVGRPSATGGNQLLEKLLDESHHVAIVGENDKAGREGAKRCATVLQNVCATVKVIYPPEGCNDLRQWLIRDGLDATRKAVKACIKSALLWHAINAGTISKSSGESMRMEYRLASEIEEKPLDWIWPEVLPRGKVSLIAGPPGLGKSLLTIEMASRISKGRDWPDGSANQCGSAVVLSGEDDPEDTILPRLRLAGADLDKVAILRGVCQPTSNGEGIRSVDLSRDILLLEEVIEKIGDVRMVVIDPISMYLGNVDSYKESEVRAILGPLGDVAARRQCAIVAVMHTVKRRHDGPAINSVSGSLGFVAAARSVWMVERDPEDSDRRLFLNGKSNVGPDSKGLAFRVVEVPNELHPVIQWDPLPMNMRADDLPHDNAHRRATLEDEAKEWLALKLSDQCVAAAKIYEEADGLGFKRHVIDRAGRSMGVVRKPHGVGGPWYWSLPGSNRKPACTNAPAVRAEMLPLDNECSN